MKGANRTQTLEQAQVCLARGGVAPAPPTWNIPAAAGVESVILKTQELVERMVAMSRLTKAIRSRREMSRTRRELNRAISNAATPSMRDELILVAQRAGNVV
jgi:hypothetical protein